MRMRNLFVWSFLLLRLVSSCDEKIIEEENHISPDYTAANINVFKKTARLNASNISSATTEDLFVNRDFFVGENNLYVINNVTDNWSIEVFDRNALKHKSTLKSWMEGDKSKSFGSAIFGVSENNGRLYVTNSSQVQIFDTNSLEFIARAGTGKWWSEEPITLTNGFAAFSFKDKLFVRDRYNLVVFNESDLIKDKPQSEIKVVARTQKGILSDMAYHSQHPISMAMHKDLLYLTDAGQKKLYVFDPETVVDSQPIPVHQEIQLSERPLSITFFRDHLYILCDGGQLLVYNAESNELVDKIVGIDKYLLETSVNRFAISANGEGVSQIFINDMTNKEITVGVVENVEIKIYE